MSGVEWGRRMCTNILASGVFASHCVIKADILQQKCDKATRFITLRCSEPSRVVVLGPYHRLINCFLFYKNQHFSSESVGIHIDVIF